MIPIALLAICVLGLVGWLRFFQEQRKSVEIQKKHEGKLSLANQEAAYWRSATRNAQDALVEFRMSMVSPLTKEVLIQCAKLPDHAYHEAWGLQIKFSPRRIAYGIHHAESGRRGSFHEYRMYANELCYDAIREMTDVIIAACEGKLEEYQAKREKKNRK